MENRVITVLEALGLSYMKKTIVEKEELLGYTELMTNHIFIVIYVLILLQLFIELVFF